MVEQHLCTFECTLILTPLSVQWKNPKTQHLPDTSDKWLKISQDSLTPILALANIFWNFKFSHELKIITTNNPAPVEFNWGPCGNMIKPQWELVSSREGLWVKYLKSKVSKRIRDTMRDDAKLQYIRTKSVPYPCHLSRVFCIPIILKT